MTAKIIDGKAIAKKLRAEYHARVDVLRSRHNVTPALVVILVGDNPASQSYVRGKIAGCKEVGIRSELVELPASTTEEQLLDHIDRLNNDVTVHGILVQLPLPAHIRVSSVLEKISVEKDVDGFHLYNMGGLVTGNTVFSPCTPYGVQKILEHENIRVEGQNVVVVGASNIVGKPTALMLMQQDATVVICHKKTRDLGHFTLLADILVVAAGVPNLIVPQIVKTGAVVIDVGFNRLPDGRIVGDVDFEGVKEKASYITPVPGGVGQMTVTMLLHNTILSAERAATATTSPFRRRA
ncbi:bifunctional methylenetetrahydrofolate dehydrogenase/methenyltetrahydrofolate cyclohydrolase FolD [Peristeroidobacter agariperforans]|uniref:bifunctional methylenetetrahydrofolate dehydrogenase/methenyltetrahydrofolate cyclohydrolase FolD n=1 Tax=Peristeroidobacter agariperforans TaxID=268404 RepID=UPI00101BAA94|nr:bifunctional methylenetetrahydrofolate dehydrogenase/methenyltetrahydrofolate cyclohydrolase FolD [Peristeroidobacter agariperforans]